LIVLIIGSVFMYEPKVHEINLPHLSSSIGNLKNYKLVLDCDIEKVEQEVTMAWIHRVPLQKDKATSIAKSFGLNNPDTIELSDNNTLRIRQGSKEIKFYDQNNILYREKNIEPVIGEYSEENMIQIANKFIGEVLARWVIDSDVNIKVDKVAPYWTSTVYLNNTEKTVTRGIGVLYSLELNGVKLAGAGSDFTVVIAEDRVISADLHIPSVHKGEIKELTVTPFNAIKNMVARESDKYESYPNAEKNDRGTLIIESIEPVYYWHHKDEMPRQLPVYYRIKGKVIKNADVGGDPIEFTVYEYAFS